jgi:DNA-binding transcriptional regulator YiaG
MTPAEIRAIVDALPITAAQLDTVMGAGIGSVSRWQLGTVTPTAPVLRLLRAYADGYRPTDWPHEGAAAIRALGDD